MTLGVAARALGVQTLLINVRRPEDIARAFDTAVKERADAAVVSLDTLTQFNRESIVELAAERYRLPAIYPSRDFVNAQSFVWSELPRPVSPGGHLCGQGTAAPSRATSR